MTSWGIASVAVDAERDAHGVPARPALEAVANLAPRRANLAGTPEVLQTARDAAANLAYPDTGNYRQWSPIVHHFITHTIRGTLEPRWTLGDAARHLNLDDTPDPDDDWGRHARCRGTNTEAFFPGKGENHILAAAKARCRTCPVQAHCLQTALNNNERHGVWGGMSPDDRANIRRKRRAAA